LEVEEVFLKTVIMNCVWFALVAFLPVSLSLNDAMSTQVNFPTMRQFFKITDLTQVKFYHAANSVAQLQEAVNGNYMMIEADIVWGIKKGEADSKRRPIMAHPPNNVSDLTFKSFLDTVIKKSTDKDFGIKLDLKENAVVEPVLKRLHEKRGSIHFPIWINADVFQGPPPSPKPDVDADNLFKLVKKYLDGVTLSLGWTTPVGSVQSLKLKYTEEMCRNVSVLLTVQGVVDAGTEVTFPVRTLMAVDSINELLSLVATLNAKASITLWSPPEEVVSIPKIKQLIQQIGQDRVYVDLPFPVPGTMQGHASEHLESKVEMDTSTTTKRPHKNSAEKEKERKNVTSTTNEVEDVRESSMASNISPVVDKTREDNGAGSGADVRRCVGWVVLVAAAVLTVFLLRH
jgi:hypothetical protein